MDYFKNGRKPMKDNMKLAQAMMLSQVIVGIASITFLIASFVVLELQLVTGFLLALLFLIMGINNYLIYRKKHFTVLYLLVGAIILGITIYGMIQHG